MSLMLLDLDHFKTYNDTLGHPQGDLLIREVASLLTSTVREVDLVARYGGDEFAVAMPRADKGSALVLAERIRKVVAGGAFEHGASIPGGRVTVSIGVSTFPDDGSDAAEVLASADRALYRAKRAGRDRVDLAQGFEQGAGTADRDADFHLLVEEDGMVHNLTPRPGALKTLESLLSLSDPMMEVLEDGDTMEHPASVPNLGPTPHQLKADVLGED
jgi:diguanylate cyclase (GGDEF)-like protein